MRVMVIDDDEQVRDMLKQMLERKGHEVTDAPNGREAMKLHRQKPADLVVTDIIMPEMEGLETIMAFRRDFPTVKMIAISGGGRIGPDSYLHSARQLGAHRVFTKPFEMRQLLNAVQELLDDSSPEDA